MVQFLEIIWSYLTQFVLRIHKFFVRQFTGHCEIERAVLNQNYQLLGNLQIVNIRGFCIEVENSKKY